MFYTEIGAITFDTDVETEKDFAVKCNLVKEVFKKYKSLIISQQLLDFM